MNTTTTDEKRLQKMLFICLLILVAIGLGRMLWLHMQPTVPKGVPQAYGVPIYEQYIAEGSAGRPGIQRQVKYIVIHETANTDSGADAKRHADLLSSGENGTTSWHYTVDDHEIYHHIPDDEVAWHAGDNLDAGGGNECGIGVELCVNRDGKFNKTFENAAKLTAALLNANGLSISAVKQHHDFMEKNCPTTIRDNGRWDEFLERVAHWMAQPSQGE